MAALYVILWVSLELSCSTAQCPATQDRQVSSIIRTLQLQGKRLLLSSLTQVIAIGPHGTSEGLGNCAGAAAAGDRRGRKRRLGLPGAAAPEAEGTDVQQPERKRHRLATASRSASPMSEALEVLSPHSF